MRLVLRLAFFVCFSFEFVIMHLLFSVWNLNWVWYRHISCLSFHNKLPFAISVVPYSQNQTSEKNFSFKLSKLGKFCEESCCNSNTQFALSRLFNSYKSKKNSLDATVALIQVPIHSPKKQVKWRKNCIIPSCNWAFFQVIFYCSFSH